MTRCLIYTRVSQDASGEGRSVDRQLDACRKLAEMRGWEITSELSDNAISAWSGAERPAWQQVLEAVELRTVDVVVAWHIDRMTRSMVDLEKLILLAEGSGVGIATATGDIDLTTDVGRMVARILAAVARAEVERKAARQRLANEQKAQTGTPWLGGARPFGYTPDQMHVVDREAAAIREAAELVLADEESLAGIAQRWSDAGLVSSRASGETKGGWTGRGVKGVLTSPRYAGIRQYRGEAVGPGTWPAILDEETHLALTVLLDNPARTMGGHTNGRRPSNLLTAIARCTVCGETVNASTYRKLDIYTCKPHGHLAAYRELADERVESDMVAYLLLPDLLGRVVVHGDAEVDAAREEADALHKRLTGLTDLFVAGSITEGQYADGTEKLRARLSDVEAVLADAGAGSLLGGLSVGAEQVVEQYNDLSLARRRKIVDAFLEVELSPVGKGKRLGFDPEQHVKTTLKVS